MYAAQRWGLGASKLGANGKRTGCTPQSQRGASSREHKLEKNLKIVHLLHVCDGDRHWLVAGVMWNKCDAVHIFKKMLALIMG